MRQPIVSKRNGLLHRAWQRLTKKTGDLGQSVVELALVLPIFIMLLGGIVEVGNAVNSYLTVIDVSRDCARLASKGKATDVEIRNMAVTEMDRLGDEFDAAQDMTIAHNVVPGAPSTRVSVCIDHPLLLPGIGIVLDDPLRMCASTTMRTIKFD